jgi:hypothetical protein
VGAGIALVHAGASPHQFFGPRHFSPLDALDACSGQAFHLSLFTFHPLSPNLCVRSKKW